MPEQNPDPWQRELAAFGARLAQLRAQANLTLQDVADDIGSSTSTLSTLERGGGARVPAETLVDRYVTSCCNCLDAVLRTSTHDDVMSYHRHLVELHDHIRRGPQNTDRPSRRKRPTERIALQGAVITRAPSGDAVLDFGRGAFDVDRIIGAVAPLSVEQARDRPSRLLQPHHGVVPFTGREQELATAATWLDAADQASVQLLHAAGGQGKTRLSGELAAAQADAGWAVWRVRHSAPATPGRAVEAAQDSGGGLDLPAGTDVLAIVDYADRWPSDELVKLARTLQQLAQVRGRRTRLLLLGRTAKNWWPALVGRLETVHQLDATGQWPLRSLATDEADRLSLFHTAARHFATRLQSGVDVSQLSAPSDLERPEYAQVLAVHMAALAAVDAQRRDETAPADLVSVADYLLCRESAAWHELQSAHMAFTRSPVMGRLAYVATLTGALPRPHARVAPRRAELANATVEADHLIDDHLACYPSGDPRTVLEPLHPDRLGEDLIALTTPGHPYTHLNWQVDDWTTAATSTQDDRVVSAAEALVTRTLPEQGIAWSWTPAALAVLAESAHRYPHLSDEVVNPLFRANPGLLLLAGGAAATRLTELPGLDLAVLEAVEPILPQTRDVNADVAAAAIVKRLAEQRLAAGAGPAQRADIHEHLAMRLERAGNYTDALRHAELAVDAARQAASRDPSDKARLATALNSHSLLCARAGRRDQALMNAREAVEIRSASASENSVPELLALANSLNTLARSLADIGENAEAVNQGDKAVHIYRALDQNGTSGIQADLAVALHNLAANRSDLGMDEEALAAAQESVALYRELAGQNPDAYMPDLADALQNLPAYLTDGGQAIEVAGESVRLYRHLVGTNPAPFLSELAGALHNLSVSQAQLGELSEALVAAEESVAIYRELADADPDAHEPDLALTLNHVAKVLSENGRREQALSAGEEVVMHFGRLAELVPGRFADEYAMALYNQASLLSENGNAVDAVVFARDAVRCYRALADSDSGLHDADLADAVHNCAFLLGEVQRYEEALPLAEEAVERYRRLADVADLAPFLAVALSTLASFYTGVGRHEEAVELAEEGVETLRAAAATGPGMWTAYLAGALATLASSLIGGGDTGHAVAASREMTEIIRRLERESPELISPHLRAAERTVTDRAPTTSTRTHDDPSARSAAALSPDESG